MEWDFAPSDEQEDSSGVFIGDLLGQEDLGNLYADGETVLTCWFCPEASQYWESALGGC